jgi:TonB family protein
MEESHQRAIACHELLHVARCDWLVNLLEELVLTLFWFHPALWWVMRSIRLAREQVVDSQVVALTGARKPYLHALLEIATASRALPVPAPLFLVESQLARRVASLVKEVRMSKSRLVASLVISLAALAATGWWAVRTFWFVAPLPTKTVVTYAPVSPPGSNAPPKTLAVYTVGGDVKAPVPIYKPEPAYSPQARKDKAEGTVVTEVVVDASGNVADVRLVRSLGKGLDESAIETIRTWKFEPATKNGKPVPVRVIVEVSFRMF